MKKYLPRGLGVPPTLLSCATINPNLPPEQVYEKKVSNFGHTNKDHLSSREFFHGYAAVINFTALYIDENGQKRTSLISKNIKLISDNAGWSQR